jgi:hypothetical protein
MNRIDILNKILKELENINSERPGDFVYSLDGYADDYDGDNLGAFIYEWEKSGFGEFRKDFPLTNELYAEIVRNNDGIVRPKAVYATIISHAEDALKEVENYKDNLFKSMNILPKEDVEKIANSFNVGLNLSFVKFINYEPDCKIYEMMNTIGDNYILICRDYRFDDSEAEERILDMELNIIALERVKFNNDYFFETKKYDTFPYIFSLRRIL